MSTIGGMFGSRTDGVPFVIDGGNMKLETQQGTRRYSTISVATIIVSKIKNPSSVGNYGSFAVKVYDKYTTLIAEVSEGIFFETIRGSMLNARMSIENPQIDTKSRLTVEFQPLHSLHAESKIKLEITNELQIPCPPTVFDYNSLLLVNPLVMSCTINTDGFNEIIINAPFVADYEYNQRNILKIVFPDTNTPLSARDITRLQISTLTEDDKLVDFFESTTTQFTVEPAPFFT